MDTVFTKMGITEFIDTDGQVFYNISTSILSHQARYTRLDEFYQWAIECGIITDVEVGASNIICKTKEAATMVLLKWR